METVTLTTQDLICEMCKVVNDRIDEYKSKSMGKSQKAIAARFMAYELDKIYEELIFALGLMTDEEDKIVVDDNATYLASLSINTNYEKLYLCARTVSAYVAPTNARAAERLWLAGEKLNHLVFMLEGF